jgi:hypothetical protein
MVTPSLALNPLVSTGPTGMTPQEIQTAYGINRIAFSGGKAAGTGAGQTIAIVDADNDPNITADLAAFDSKFGLPAPPSFTVDNLGGSQTDAGWALETALDVEWAHAVAPKASIVLVEASSASLSGLLGAVRYASSLAGVSVVSMSWGTNEFYGEWSYDNVFTTPAGHTSVTFVAASGDSGAWSGPSYPSVAPNVLAVGGTSLSLSATGSYGSETGWTDSTGGFSGLDNGFWYGIAEPSYQAAALTAAGLNYGIRTTPDVSLNADPNSGVAVYDSVSYSGQSGWFQVGGTSAAAPAWAGLVAIADQGLATGGKGTLSTTTVLTDLYSLPSSDFHDVTTGFNGYYATAGYDLVTGLGTPKANLLVAGVLAAAGVSTTSTAASAPHAPPTTASASSSHSFASVNTTSSAPAAGSSASSASPLPVAITTTSPANLPTAALGLAPLSAVTVATSPGAVSSISVQPPPSGAAASGSGSVTNVGPGQSLLVPPASSRGASHIDLEPSPFVDYLETEPVSAAPVPDQPISTRAYEPAEAPAPQPTPPAPALDPRLDDRLERPATRPGTPNPMRPLPDSMLGHQSAGKSGDGRPSSILGAAAIAAGGYLLVFGSTERTRRRLPSFLLPGLR